MTNSGLFYGPLRRRGFHSTEIKLSMPDWNEQYKKLGDVLC